MLRNKIANTFSLQIGYTPLHYASRNGHTDVVELLIEHGAQVDVPAGVSRSVCRYGGPESDPTLRLSDCNLLQVKSTSLTV